MDDPISTATSGAAFHHGPSPIFGGVGAEEPSPHPSSSPWVHHSLGSLTEASFTYVSELENLVASPLVCPGNTLNQTLLCPLAPSSGPVDDDSASWEASPINGIVAPAPASAFTGIIREFGARFNRTPISSLGVPKTGGFSTQHVASPDNHGVTAPIPMDPTPSETKVSQPSISTCHVTTSRPHDISYNAVLPSEKLLCQPSFSYLPPTIATADPSLHTVLATSDPSQTFGQHLGGPQSLLQPAIKQELRPGDLSNQNIALDGPCLGRDTPLSLVGSPIPSHPVSTMREVTSAASGIPENGVISTARQQSKLTNNSSSLTIVPYSPHAGKQQDPRGKKRLVEMEMNQSRGIVKEPRSVPKRDGNGNIQGTFMTFGDLPRKRAPFTPEKKRQTALARKEGVCLRCKKSKRKVTSEAQICPACSSANAWAV